MSEASLQEKIYLTAKANIGDKSWARDVPRQEKRNKHVYFDAGEYKCNLFVYEVLLACGVDVGTKDLHTINI